VCIALILSLTILSAAPSRISINVADFGAKGGAGTDDAKAIQAAIDAAPPGSSVIFPARDYHLRRPLVLRSNRIYQGRSGAIIHAPKGEFAAISEYDATSGIVVDGLTFDGGGLSFSGERVPARGIRVLRSAFLNILNSGPDWPVHTGLFCPSGLRDSVIEGNRFYNILDGGSTDPIRLLTANALAVYHGLDRTSIANNSFEKVQQGMYVQFSGDGPYVDVIVARNSGVKVHRMGIEMQGGGTTNLLVEDNRFVDFLDPNPGTFGISVAVDGGKHSVVRNNIVIAQPAATTYTPWGTRYGIGIEIGGEDASVYGNHIAGFWHTGIAIGNAPKAAIRDNYLCGSPGARNIRPETNLRLITAIQGNTDEAGCKPEKRGRVTNDRTALR
jgi:hypothetical protein